MVTPDFTCQSLLEILTARYDVVTEDVHVGSSVFRLLAVRDTNALLDRLDPASFAHDERMPYWAELWTSSIELARWCLEETELNGKTVLELGCGLGLGGIAAAHAGATVTMTDYEDDALLFARYNALLNPGPAIPHIVPFDWRESTSLGLFDVVIGGDIVYERRNFLPVVQALHALLKPSGVAVLTEPDRGIGRDFFAFAANGGFSVETSSKQWTRRGREAMITRSLLRRLR